MYQQTRDNSMEILYTGNKRDKKMQSPIVQMTILSCIALITLSCNESLPAYNPPENVLRVSISSLTTPTDTIRYTMIDNNNPNLVAVSLNSPFNGYEISIVNLYEETIQDNMEIEGTVELSWVDKPELKTILKISNTSFYDGNLDPVTGLLTLNPTDTVHLRIFWNFKLATDDWAFSQIQYIDGPMYNAGSNKFVADRFHQTMLLHGTVKVKLFKSLSFVEAQTKEDFSVTFKGKIFSPP